MSRQFPNDTKTVKAQFNQGSTLHQKGQLAQAREIYLQILTQHPHHLETLYLLGAIALQTHRPQEALEWLNQAVAVNDQHPGVHCNRGTGVYTLKHYSAALASYDRAIALHPAYAEAYSNRGNVLREQRHYEAAIHNYAHALTLKPQDVDTLVNHGNILREMKRYPEALESYRRALALAPDYPYLDGILRHTQAHLCDWQAGMRTPAELTYPFPFLALCDDPHLQRQVATLWAQTEYPLHSELGAIVPRKAGHHSKIRIGYFSADLHAHATAFLMAELWEHHDKSRFEIIAFSFGVDSHDAMRQRLARTFDQFIDVRNHTDKEIAQLARQMEIDIAVDLKGFTQDSRFGIFSYRAAPIQVSYIGYPGTVGAEYMDYIVADKTLIPETAQAFYSEKVVYLPHSYQVNDRKREISDITFTRESLGLPASGFIFCCFNNNYKITPPTFDGWMRILHQVPNSVLWLLEDNATAAANLRKEAKARGIEPHRLIFAARMPLPEHLARHRVADLFIDSLPYNAHTTASDALWAGLPVLTCMGESFASRVAGSLLNAIELPELITTTQAEFEVRAVELALNHNQLKMIRDKLDKNRLTTPLFDSELFTRHLENAYEQMMQRYHASLPPYHITVNTLVKKQDTEKPTERKIGLWNNLTNRISGIFSSSAP